MLLQCYYKILKQHGNDEPVFTTDLFFLSRVKHNASSNVMIDANVALLGEISGTIEKDVDVITACICGKSEGDSKHVAKYSVHAKLIQCCSFWNVFYYFVMSFGMLFISLQCLLEISFLWNVCVFLHKVWIKSVNLIAKPLLKKVIVKITVVEKNAET